MKRGKGLFGGRGEGSNKLLEISRERSSLIVAGVRRESGYKYNCRESKTNYED